MLRKDKNLLLQDCLHAGLFILHANNFVPHINPETLACLIISLTNPNFG